MKRLRILSFFAGLLLCTAFLSGCGNDSRELREVVERNIAAANAKDVDRYVEDLDGSKKKLSKMVMEPFFKNYDVSFKLTDFKVISWADSSKEGRSAVIEVTTETKRISGPAFRDNRTTVRHQMKKIDGKWKFSQSKVMKTEYLE